MLKIEDKTLLFASIYGSNKPMVEKFNKKV